MQRLRLGSPMRWRSALALAAALASAGCNGPKDSCDGTLESYAGTINGQAWDDMLELFMPSQRSKYGDRKLKMLFKETWFGAKNFKWKFMQADVDKAGDLCIARTSARWNTKIRGKNEETTDDFGDVFTLHLQPDGKWYMDVPGSQKLGGY